MIHKNFSAFFFSDRRKTVPFQQSGGVRMIHHRTVGQVLPLDLRPGLQGADVGVRVLHGHLLEIHVPHLVVAALIEYLAAELVFSHNIIPFLLQKRNSISMGSERSILCRRARRVVAPYNAA